MKTTMKTTTHKGLAVELFFFDQDPNDHRGLQAGWVCHRVEARVGGEEVGYLKIEYVPSATIEETLPTIWHWWSSTDWQAGKDDWEGVWFQAHWACRAIPASLKGELKSAWHLSRKMVPDRETIDQDLAALENWVGNRTFDNPWREFAKFKRDHMDRPKVAFIRSHHSSIPELDPDQKDWRRQGIATLLYIEGAKWMAKKGFPLWASTLQKDEATAVWDTLVEGRYPIVEMPCPWKPEQPVRVLDYR